MIVNVSRTIAVAPPPGNPQKPWMSILVLKNP